MGAPIKLTKAVHLIIVASISKGLPWCHAAAMADIDERTLHDWRVKGEESVDETNIYFRLYRDIKRAKAERVQERLDLIDSAAKGGNWTAAAWELERTDSDNFSLKQKIQHSGAPGEPFEIKITVDDDKDNE